MENLTVTGLRPRSRSKTPFLRSNGENSDADIDQIFVKSGRKTPVKRSTPVRHVKESSTIIEEFESNGSAVAQRTRQSVRVTSQKIIKTSDYSSEESLDRLKGNEKRIYQAEANSRDERVSTSARDAASFADVTFSPITSSRNVTEDRSARWGSPAYSACSTDSSFAEQALADASALLDADPAADHLPSKLYRRAGEYWNKYPKTDYTYSRLSKDRVELAPGQVAVPNMSRRSLAHFRIHGPVTSVDEVDLVKSMATRRYKDFETSDDEGYITSARRREERSLITRTFITVITTITTVITTVYHTITGHRQRQSYAYAARNNGPSILSLMVSYLMVPFHWIYSVVKNTTTSTITKITHNNVHHGASVSKHYSRDAAERRRWWPWLLFVLLLPILGYGCCQYFYDAAESNLFVQYKPATIDADMHKRIQALENWASNLDAKLNIFNQHLSVLDDLDSKIEGHMDRHLQRNFATIVNLVAGSEAVMARFKDYFDKLYVTHDQMAEMGRSVRESILNQMPRVDEEKINQIIKAYLSSYEKRQTLLLLEKVKEYVKEVEVQRTEVGFDVNAVKRIVEELLKVYDADKTGMVDYALESAGGQVISTRCTELYQVKTKQYSVLGVFRWWVYSSPRQALTPGAMPGECWAFQGFPGYLVIRTFAIIEVTGFSMEHMSRLLAPDGAIDSAPKNFSVYGLHGELDPEPHLFGQYIYDSNGTSIQYFPVQHPKTTNIGGTEYPVAYDLIELRVESNHGDPTYTCVYRFRVHGNRLTDVRKATEDTIRQSENQ